MWRLKGIGREIEWIVVKRAVEEVGQNVDDRVPVVRRFDGNRVIGSVVGERPAKVILGGRDSGMIGPIDLNGGGIYAVGSEQVNLVLGGPDDLVRDDVGVTMTQLEEFQRDSLSRH